MIKKAMIMAAGVGSRLGLLSDILPKPLVPLANIPVIDILLKHLASFQINNVIANTYYKAESIQSHCQNNSYNVNFNYIQENELSGTAGGLEKCRFFLDSEDDFIVMSADGLTDIDIEAAFDSHKRSGKIATIVAKNVEHNEVSKYGIIVPDKNGLIESFQEKPPIERARSNLANTGIYLFKHEIFDFIPPNTFYDFAKDVFTSFMDKKIAVNTYIHYGYWSDIGSISQYKLSNFDILEGKIPYLKPDIEKINENKFIKGYNTLIDTSSKLIGNNVIGNNCRIGKNCVIKNSILWDNIIVNDNILIENSIILSNSIVDKSVKDDIITVSTVLT